MHAAPGREVEEPQRAADDLPGNLRHVPEERGCGREQGGVQLGGREQAVLRRPLVLGQLVDEPDDGVDVALLDGPDRHPRECRLTWSRQRTSPW